MKHLGEHLKRISKAVSGSDWLGFTKPTCKELKQDQHNFVFMEGLLCYP